MRGQQGVISLLTRGFHGIFKRLMWMRPGPALCAVHHKIGIPRQQNRQAVTALKSKRTVHNVKCTAFVQHTHLGFIIEVDGVFVRCKLGVSILGRMAMPHLPIVLPRKDFTALQRTHSGNTIAI